MFFFVISKENVFLSDYRKMFSLTLNSINPTDFGPSMHKDCAQVRIVSPCSRNLHSMVITAEKERFLFSYFPDEVGTYTIDPCAPRSKGIPWQGYSGNL